jgi:GntR family transcriptional repressor for pyruvate dehydrogenase complex
MTLPIKPIKPKRISDQVFDQIRELIFKGKLKPGQKLMPERELAEAMSVSRTTVRDAIQRLAAMGMIVQKQGQGTFVKTYDGGMENNPFAKAMRVQDASIEDLLEVRMGLECNAAALAAQRADGADLAAMEQSIEEMKQEIALGRLGTEADVSFHMAVAYGAKNPLQVIIMHNFHDYLSHGIRESLAFLYEDMANIEQIFLQHGSIVAAIKGRNPHEAYMEMKKHITFVLDCYKSRSGG